MSKIGLGAVVISMVVAPAARAESPALLPIQGHLTTPAGAPVSGPVILELSLHGTSTSGPELFREQQTTVADNGDFLVYLGAVAPLSLALFRDRSAVWLQIVANGDVLTPRFRLGSTPWAGFAQYCGEAATLEGASASDFAPVDHTHAFPTYTASTGLSLSGTTFSVERSRVESWARNACFDTTAELRAALDAVYLAPSWASLQSVPLDLLDGDDDTTYSAGDGLALAGTRFSVAPGGITSAMIRDGAVTGADIAPDSLTARNLDWPPPRSLPLMGVAPQITCNAASVNATPAAPYGSYSGRQVQYTATLTMRAEPGYGGEMRLEVEAECVGPLPGFACTVWSCLDCGLCTGTGFGWGATGPVTVEVDRFPYPALGGRYTFGVSTDGPDYTIRWSNPRMVVY